MELIPPMLAKSGSLPKNETEYAYEIKWDGLRAIVYYENREIEIRSRNNKILTKQYPELLSMKDVLGKKSIVLDGEIVYLAANGYPSFSGLQHRMGVTSAQKISELMQRYPVTYVIFDILYLDKKLLIDLPYLKRRELLDKLSLSGNNFQVSSFVEKRGSDMLVSTKKLGLEGVMAKKLDSLYFPGKRTNEWLKIKNKRSQEFVIGGWLPGQNARAGSIGSLLVGYYTKDAGKSNLIYAGKVGTGFTASTLKKLGLSLSALKRETSPFSSQTPKDAIFTEPKLVGEFEFTEWTPHNTLRHPSFKGLRNDKQPEDVVKENQ